MALPIYLALPPGSLRDTLHDHLGGTATVVAPPGAGLEPSALEPGVLLVDAEAVPLSALLRLVQAFPPDGGGWVVAAVVSAQEGPRIHAVSLGSGHEVEEVRRHADDPASAPQVLVDLSRCLREIARARHDVNNPLTAALAETQLALLDAPDGELRESLEIIQAQLRRMRDLVAATGHLRPPRD